MEKAIDARAIKMLQNVTFDSISKMSNEQIIEIDTFFISLSKEKLDEIPRNVIDEIYNRAIRIKIKKINYESLTLQDISKMGNNQILVIDEFFASKTPFSKEKLGETSLEVRKAIFNRAVKIKMNSPD